MNSSESDVCSAVDVDVIRYLDNVSCRRYQSCGLLRTSRECRRCGAVTVRPGELWEYNKLSWLVLFPWGLSLFAKSHVFSGTRFLRKWTGCSSSNDRHVLPKHAGGGIVFSQTGTNSAHAQIVGFRNLPHDWEIVRISLEGCVFWEDRRKPLRLCLEWPGATMTAGPIIRAGIAGVAGERSSGMDRNQLR